MGSGQTGVVRDNGLNRNDKKYCANGDLDPDHNERLQQTNNRLWRRVVVLIRGTSVSETDKTNGDIEIVDFVKDRVLVTNNLLTTNSFIYLRLYGVNRVGE